MNPLGAAVIDGAIAALELAPGARVLETGCGAGAVLLRILEAHADATGVGVDPDGSALRLARERGGGRPVQWIEAAADEAGLEPGSFDLVVNVASSHAHGGFPGALSA